MSEKRYNETMKKLVVPSFILVILSAISLFIYFKSYLDIKPVQTLPSVSSQQKVKYPQDYTIVLVGDSMTERLGNSDELRAYLKEFYPKKSFEVLNYGFGSTNLLSVEKRLKETTFYNRDFRPILDINFDVLILESFGHNPLSQFSLEEGKQKQTEELEKIIRLTKEANPHAQILFLATIAPNSKLFGMSQVDLSPEERSKWAAERRFYIKNHIEFAQKNNIPLINVYEKSLNKEDGDGNIKYISSDDYIHPSPSGVYLISKEIANLIYSQKILEQVTATF